MSFTQTAAGSVFFPPNGIVRVCVTRDVCVCPEVPQDLYNLQEVLKKKIVPVP